MIQHYIIKRQKVDFPELVNIKIVSRVGYAFSRRRLVSGSSS